MHKTNRNLTLLYSLFSIVVYYRAGADAKADKSGTASPTSDTLTSAKSGKAFGTEGIKETGKPASEKGAKSEKV